VIHNVPLALFGFIAMLAQPTHGCGTSIDITVFGIDFHAPALRGIIEPFAAKTKTSSVCHKYIVQ
jgi:hypothetical protein